MHTPPASAPIDRSVAPTPWSRNGGIAWFLPIFAIIVLLLALGWVLRIEQRLPELRRALDEQGAVDPSGRHLLAPGEHSPRDPAITTSGDWFTQALGAQTALVTDSAGSSLAFRFYGTDVSLVARIGPEANKVYVTIDGAAAPGLLADSTGAYISLRSTQAKDQLLSVATGLAHREHAVTLRAAPGGELAISSIEIRASTPFPWAFTLVETALAGLIFLAARDVALRAARAVGWLSDEDDLSGSSDRA